MRGPVLVLGAGGLLGRTMITACERAGIEVAGLGHAECDIARAHDVATAFERVRPRWCINAAAATDVDRCEREPAWGWRVNALGPRRIAAACRRHRTRCVHVSTDYVFSGETDRPYDESDLPAPRSAYGRGKYAGEQAVLALCPDALVLRTAWLFGPGGRNFVSRMPGLLRERGRIEAVHDQLSSPTAASDLAGWIVRNAERAAGGLYHVVNEGALSYAECARVIARALGLDPDHAVCGIEGGSIERPAPRPRCSALRSVALRAEGLEILPPARTALEAFARAE